MSGRNPTVCIPGSNVDAPHESGSHIGWKFFYQMENHNYHEVS